jgi:molybdate transport system substrate-binding protein
MKGVLIRFGLSAFLVTGFFWSSLVAEVAYAKPVITTGAGYKTMVEALVAAFRETGGQIEEAYGGHIGQLVAQIAQGSGSNIVVSDQGTLEAVAGDVKFASFTPLGETPLVLAWRKGLSLKEPNDLLKPEFKKVAHPDPKGAIYGRAAVAYLKSSGLGDRLGDKVMAVSSVPQVMAYLVAGEIDAGFVNRAVLKADNQIGGSKEIETGYPPIKMVAAVVDGAEADPLIQAFIKFLSSQKAKEILRSFGVWL